MGIFGYNEKNFHKNTRKFANALSDIAEQCRICLASGDSREFNDVLKLLCLQMKLLDAMKFPGKHRVESLETIDNQIDDYINKMIADVNAKKVRRLFSHAELLHQWIKDFRKGGEIPKDNPERLKYQELLAERRVEILELLDEEKEIQSRMNEFIERAKKIVNSNNKSEMANIHREYGRYSSKIQNIRIKKDLLSREYCAYIDIVSIRKSLRALEKIESLDHASFSNSFCGSDNKGEADESSQKDIHELFEELMEKYEKDQSSSTDTDEVNIF